MGDRGRKISYRSRLEAASHLVVRYSGVSNVMQPLNSSSKDKEVIRLGLRPPQTPCFLGRTFLIALSSTSINKEVITSLPSLSDLIWGGCQMEGEENLPENAPSWKSSGPLQNRFWSGQSSVVEKAKARAMTPEGGGICTR